VCGATHRGFESHSLRQRRAVRSTLHRMADMSPAQVREFLSHGTRTGKFATTRANGAPHVVPIWFVLDGDDLIFTTHEESLKGRTLQRERRVAVCVDDQAPPYSYVTVEGVAEVETDLDELRRWATRIGGRYMGEDRAEEFGRRNGVPGELLVRVRPTKVIGHAAVAD
jgi:PPOX class probable F420-dependent enzyme